MFQSFSDRMKQYDNMTERQGRDIGIDEVYNEIQNVRQQLDKIQNGLNLYNNNNERKCDKSQPEIPFSVKDVRNREDESIRRTKVRLTESQLRGVIRQCVNEALNELAPETYISYSNKRKEQANTATNNDDRAKYLSKSIDGRNAGINAWNKQYSKSVPNNYLHMDYGHDVNTNYTGGYNGEHFQDISVSDSDENGEMKQTPLVNQQITTPNNPLDGRQIMYNPTNDKIRFTQQGSWAKQGGSKGGYGSRMQGFPDHLQTARRMFSKDPSQFYVKGKGYQGY